MTKVRILDFGHTTAGAFGTMLLADLGAQVIKIEAGEGDLLRTSAGPRFQGENYFHVSMNRNKKSILLDLATASGKETFYDLVRISDVVWNNFRYGAMKRLGADYDTLKKINPRIICCSITGFGSSGPYRDRTSWDTIAQSFAGLLSVTGEVGGRPVKPGITLADLGTSVFAACGVLAALYTREQTGVGQNVEVSQLDSMVALMTNQISYYFCGGGVPGPEGTGHSTVVPFGVYPTKEGYITIGPSWPRIARAVGAEWMMDDPRFKDGDARIVHRKEVDAVLTERLSQAKAEDWLEIMHVEDIPAAPVNTIDKTVVDPQVLNNKMIVSVKHPSDGELKMAGCPIKMERRDEKEYSFAPSLGEHTEQVLTELLGYSKDKIQKVTEEREKHFAELLTRKHKML